MGNGRTNAGGGGLSLSQKQMTLKSAGAISKGQYVYGRLSGVTSVSGGGSNYYNDSIAIDGTYRLSSDGETYKSNDERHAVTKLLGNDISTCSTTSYSSNGIFLPLENEKNGVWIMSSYTTRKVSQSSSYYLYYFDYTIYAQPGTPSGKQGSAGSIAMASGDQGQSDSYYYWFRVKSAIKIDNSNMIILIDQVGLRYTTMYLVTKNGTTNCSLKLLYTFTNDNSQKVFVKNFLKHGNNILCYLSNNTYIEILWNSSAKNATIGSAVQISNLNANFQNIHYDEANNSFVIDFQSYGSNFVITSVTAIWSSGSFGTSNVAYSYLTMAPAQITGIETPPISPVAQAANTLYFMAFLNIGNLKALLVALDGSARDKIQTSISSSNLFGVFRTYTLGGTQMSFVGLYYMVGDNILKLETNCGLSVKDAEVKVTSENSTGTELPIGIAMTSTSGPDQEIAVSLIM